MRQPAQLRCAVALLALAVLAAPGAAQDAEPEAADGPAPGSGEEKSPDPRDAALMVDIFGLALGLPILQPHCLWAIDEKQTLDVGYVYWGYLTPTELGQLDVTWRRYFGGNSPRGYYVGGQLAVYHSWTEPDLAATPSFEVGYTGFAGAFAWEVTLDIPLTERPDVYTFLALSVGMAF